MGVSVALTSHYAMYENNIDDETEILIFKVTLRNF